MWTKTAIAVALALLAGGCAMSSNWHLMDSGYAIDTENGSDFAIEVHLNQLKEFGGDVNSSAFRHFVAERLKIHDLCPKGWTVLPCIEDGSCVQHTSRSVTVFGSCTP
ncbi:MAG TPA: hypothetical protein VFR57_00855 [Burkholderiales bacterium]|nr:hypothetical protein [Burkholderiales bacterium]